LKTSRASKQIVKAKAYSADSQSLSRRQALLLGAGTLAASNFATPDTVQAETEAVTASGKSAETVQLGQSGLVVAALYSFVTHLDVAAADTAERNAGLQISPVGVGAWSWGDRTGEPTFTVLCTLLTVLLGSRCHAVAALSRILGLWQRVPER
jgi:hypothetical protein